MSLEFFSATLSSQGFYCIATLQDAGKFRHRFFDDKEKAYTFALDQDSKGETVYYAQASFESPKNRKADNAVWLRSYFLDIDCGPKKPYSTQKDGVIALKKFCEAAKIPIPSVVNSGNGLYAYWILTEDVDSRTWVATAQLIKGLCERLGFNVDPVRTSDRTSVLRPVGATNRKGTHKTVSNIFMGAPVSDVDFRNLLLESASKQRIDTKTFSAPDTQLNAEFQIEMSGEKPSAHRIADRCSQIGLVREKKGDVQEPLWYAAIGLLKSTVEAPEIIHEWSSGYAGYSREETDRKIDQHKVHATTCHYFHSINPSLCVGCRYHGKINSPFRLGLPDPKPVAVPEDVLEVKLPMGFSRTDRGIIYDSGEDAAVNVFPYDLLPVKLTQDESLGQEIMHMRAKDPHTGWFDVLVRTALLHDGKLLLMTLADQGIHPYYGKTERALFMQLLSGYMQTLKDNRRKQVLSQQMGWLEEPDGTLAFVLGDRLISARGVETVGIAKGADTVVRAITKQGEAEKWATTTKILDEPGLEPWAFTLAALGFGAPLMRFTGYKGSMLSMVGRSGLGKTAMGWWSLSVWGNPEKLQMIQRDTQNATVARMSLYNSLPLFIDEITNIKPDILSDLAYQITQGRDKHTLTRARTERSALPWATIGAASSNKSLVDVLGGYKADAGAEINRIFEYEFPAGTVFDGVTAYHMFRDNYGVAGEPYVQYLVEHQDELAGNLLRVQAMIHKKADCRPEERFWVITAACAVYGASIARKLGLLHLDINRLVDWIVVAIRSMRGVKEDTTVDSPSWLGTFLSKHTSNMIVVSKMVNASSGYSVLIEPRGPLYIRKDNETNTLWIARDQLKRELLAGSASYSKIKQELVATRALVSDSRRMMLGKGTQYSGLAEITWQIDLNNPTLGYVNAQLVKTEEEASSDIQFSKDQIRN